jgi:hypothetical protein
MLAGYVHFLFIDLLIALLFYVFIGIRQIFSN